jgi:hypothetical protein
MVLRYFLVALLIVGSSPAFCENDVLPEDMLQKLLPPNVTKVGFLGDLLAVIAFCNLNKEVQKFAKKLRPINGFAVW